MSLATTSTAAAKRSFSHIKDPKNLLERLDSFVGRPEFDKAFKCGRSITYEMNSCARYCEPFTCNEVCDPTVKEYKIQIRDCKKDSVTVFNATTSKPWFTITPETYAAHNFIRFVLAAPWSGKPDKSAVGEDIGKNYIKLTDLKNEKFALKSGKVLEATRLYFTYFHFDQHLKEYVPSAQSILMPRFEETAGLHLDHTFYEVKKPIARVTEITDP